MTSPIGKSPFFLFFSSFFLLFFFFFSSFFRYPPKVKICRDQGVANPQLTTQIGLLKYQSNKSNNISQVKNPARLVRLDFSQVKALSD